MPWHRTLSTSSRPPSGSEVTGPPGTFTSQDVRCGGQVAPDDREFFSDFSTCSDGHSCRHPSLAPRKRTSGIRRAGRRSSCVRTLRRSLGLTLRRYAGEQFPDLGLAVPAVAAKCANRTQLSSLCPPSNRLRVDAEHRRNFGRGEQWLGLRRSCVHEASSVLLMVPPSSVDPQ